VYRKRNEHGQGDGGNPHGHACSEEDVDHRHADGIAGEEIRYDRSFGWVDSPDDGQDHQPDTNQCSRDGNPVCPESSHSSPIEQFVERKKNCSLLYIV